MTRVLPGLAARLGRKLKFIAFEFCEGSPAGQSTSVHFRGQTTHYLSFSRQLNISTKLQTTFMGLNKVFQFLLVIARLRSDCSRDSELTILSPSSCQQSSIVLWHIDNTSDKQIEPNKFCIKWSRDKKDQVLSRTAGCTLYRDGNSVDLTYSWRLEPRRTWL